MAESRAQLLWDSAAYNDGESVETGIASLAIAQGRIYTMGDRLVKEEVEVKKGDKVDKKTVYKGDGFLFCLDAETGKEIWKSKIGPSYYNSVRVRRPLHAHPRRRSALRPLAARLARAAAKLKDGSILWQKNLVKDFGGRMMSGWGYSESPLVDGEKRRLHTRAGKTAALVALDKLTGAVMWKCAVPANSGAGYASIVTTEVGGIKQYITLLGKELGLIGVDANSGSSSGTMPKLPTASPIPTALVQGPYVFTATGYGAAPPC